VTSGWLHCCLWQCSSSGSSRHTRPDLSVDEYISSVCGSASSSWVSYVEPFTRRRVRVFILLLHAWTTVTLFTGWHTLPDPGRQH